MKKRNVWFMMIAGMLLCTGCHMQNPKEEPESVTVIQEEEIPKEDAGEQFSEGEPPINEGNMTGAADTPNTADSDTIAGTVDTENEASAEESASAKAEQTPKDTMPTSGMAIIEGSQFIDGREVPVTVSMTLEKTRRGEEAYKALADVDKNIPEPGGDEEYMIFTFDVSYDDGEVDEIYLMENRASLENAGLYFALSNGDSNAEDMTGYVSNSIYDLVIPKGMSAKGEVAFLHKTGADAPLHFVGFGKDTVFAVEKADGAAQAVSWTESEEKAILYGIIGDLGTGYLAYAISGHNGEDYRLYFLESQESWVPLSEANISLRNADYIFPDVRAGNAAIGNFLDIYFLDTVDLTGDGRTELFIIARYNKDGRKYFDTRIYEMNENGASVKDDLIRKLNKKYCNVEDYPVEEAKTFIGNT